MNTLSERLAKLLRDVETYARHSEEATFRNGQAGARHKHALACDDLARELVNAYRAGRLIVKDEAHES